MFESKESRTGDSFGLPHKTLPEAIPHVNWNPPLIKMMRGRPKIKHEQSDKQSDSKNVPCIGEGNKDYKYCPYHDEYHLLSEFGKNTARHDGLQSQCKKARKEIRDNRIRQERLQREMQIDWMSSSELVKIGYMPERDLRPFKYPQNDQQQLHNKICRIVKKRRHNFSNDLIGEAEIYNEIWEEIANLSSLLAAYNSDRRKTAEREGWFYVEYFYHEYLRHTNMSIELTARRYVERVHKQAYRSNKKADHISFSTFEDMEQVMSQQAVDIWRGTGAPGVRTFTTAIDFGEPSKEFLENKYGEQDLWKVKNGGMTSASNEAEEMHTGSENERRLIAVEVKKDVEKINNINKVGGSPYERARKHFNTEH